MRKSTLFTAAFICTALASQAQISKGSLFLGGSLGFSSSENESTFVQPGNFTQKNESSGWGVRPQIGTAVANNQILGLFLNFTKNRNEQTTGTNVSLEEISNNGGGIFFRRYYPFGQRFFLFGEAGLGVNFSERETTTDNGTVRYVSGKLNTTGAAFSITPGLSFAASRKLYLEASLNDLFSLAYNSNDGKSYDFRGNLQSTSEGKDLSANLNANGFSNLTVGVRWILPRKK